MLDYSKVLRDYSWITESHDIILSPDSDWMLCWLLLTNFTNCRVVWYYDWKIMLIKDGIDYNNCVFVDMDVNRSNIKSIWHHCVMYNKKLIPETFEYWTNCLQPNLMRNFDWANNFQQKYPFGTIHLLVCVLHHAWIIDNIRPEWIWPLLFTDWVWNNLFWYTENCLERIDFLWINNQDNPLYYHFCGNSHSFYDIMKWLDTFLRTRDSFNAQWYFNWTEYVEWWRNKRTWDKLKISKPNWEINNLVKEWNLYKIHDVEVFRIKWFIKSMASYINWEYIEDKWEWDGFVLKEFTKWDFSNSKLNGKTYLDLMSKRPFSMAMTSWLNIEYTLE